MALESDQLSQSTIEWLDRPLKQDFATQLQLLINQTPLQMSPRHAATDFSGHGLDAQEVLRHLALIKRKCTKERNESAALADNGDSR